MVQLSLLLAAVGTAIMSVQSAPAPQSPSTTFASQTPKETPTSFNGDVILYDATASQCTVNIGSMYPASLNGALFGQWTENPQPDMCNKCINVQGPAANITAHIVGICEGCSSVELPQEAIAKLTNVISDTFIYDVPWQIINCS
ncbi:hypothetical protein GGI25_001700 [Coemansia spiralis]|uniref:Uncharacterized protein n=1 Tax=Coemansia spiralis TaxID=417178 RepID=A0A9W8L000_9FUNG|nr:hypothetical protein BX070DRAFT_261237 [Coemansia spiralis]KAJ2624960.1 hypothetical protein GGI26_001072 [Coemansia sp. RSA 1358]KAJ2679132.1 hypothetical protein GGI25_001700 [Coemansia spiralis]